MKSSKRKKYTIYVAALLLASTFFIADEVEARGGRGGRAVGRFNGGIGQRFGGVPRRNFGQGLIEDGNSQTGSYLGRNNSHNNQAGNQSEKRSFNASDTVREYQTTNSEIDRHIEGTTERGGDYSRDKSVTYNKEDGLTKTVNTQGTTATGGQFDRNKNVSFEQGEGYNKNVNMQGTTGNSGEYDHNKKIDYSQESGYSKQASTIGINANGEAFEHERKTNWTK